MGDKNITLGIYAHVDAGKTSLSEALLFAAGEIRRQGRVDHRDSFLDTDVIERQRGITIFSKQALIHLPGVRFTLIDTPGHVDFSAETERTMSVLDCAVLVISGSDGIQSHTATLWKLLRRYQVPTFLFVNKMDLPGADPSHILSQLSSELSEGCIDFDNQDEEFFETAALLDADLMNEYIRTGKIGKDALAQSISLCRLFPVYFGSALRSEGTDVFLKALARYAVEPVRSDVFSAKVFKISQDDKGKRISHLKVTGGCLRLKETVRIGDAEEKINEIRQYSGLKYTNLQLAMAGTVCQVPGLVNTFSGQGLGAASDDEALFSTPVLSYSVRLPEGTDILKALAVFRQLEEEEGTLHVVYNQRLRKININLMGEIQLEVIRQMLADRWQMKVDFDEGSVIYLETIMNTVEGVGHYEPLRHYAEVHLMLQPGPRGSGITADSALSTDKLDLNWQRLILTHVFEKTHLGVLIGAPITDVHITLVNGRNHLKHTEGGDFRQACYRAIRQGLMQAESVILEPWYSFIVRVPQDMTGKILTELDRLGARLGETKYTEQDTEITGVAPVASMRSWQKNLAAMTHGMGSLALSNYGYHPCKNQDKLMAEAGYHPQADLENSPDSVFCSHGAGDLVPWNEVFSYMHLPLQKQKREEISSCCGTVPANGVRSAAVTQASDEELMRIFESTYGKIKETQIRPLVRSAGDPSASPISKKVSVSFTKELPDKVYVDGYNMIFAWPEYQLLAAEGLHFARMRLIDRLSNYAAYTGKILTLVFDAYKVHGAIEKREEIDGMTVVYTKEGETADRFIERSVANLPKGTKTAVATSDQLEQISIMGHGALRMSAPEFLSYVETAEKEMRKYIL